MIKGLLDISTFPRTRIARMICLREYSRLEWNANVVSSMETNHHEQQPRQSLGRYLIQSMKAYCSKRQRQKANYYLITSSSWWLRNATPKTSLRLSLQPCSQGPINASMPWTRYHGLRDLRTSRNDHHRSRCPAPFYLQYLHGYSVSRRALVMNQFNFNSPLQHIGCLHANTNSFDTPLIARFILSPCTIFSVWPSPSVKVNFFFPNQLDRLNQPCALSHHHEPGYNYLLYHHHTLCHYLRSSYSIYYQTRFDLASAWTQSCVDLITVCRSSSIRIYMSMNHQIYQSRCMDISYGPAWW